MRLMGKIASVFALVLILTITSAATLKESPRPKAKLANPVQRQEKKVQVKKQKVFPEARVVSIEKPTKPQAPQKNIKRRIATIDFTEMEIALANNNIHKPVTPEEITHAAAATRHRVINFDDNFPDE